MEDGRRDDDRSGAMEWWCFDAVLDDGTKVVAHFHTKQPATAKSKTPRPQSGLVITLPDGTVYSDEPFCKPEEMRCAKEKCDIHFAENWVTGNLKHYDIHFENKNGIGEDLKYSEVYRNKQNWIDRKYRKAYYNNKRWDFPHKCLRRRC